MAKNNILDIKYSAKNRIINRDTGTKNIKKVD